MSAAGADDGLAYRYRWPRPSVTVDCLIYALDEGTPWILLIKRKNDPFQGSWALPGEHDTIALESIQSSLDYIRKTSQQVKPSQIRSNQVKIEPQ